MDRETEQCQGPDRRRLLAVSCGLTFGLLMHRMALGASSQKAGQEFVETTCPTNARPAKRVLIAYASRYGSTGTVAGAIAEVLCGMGHQVDVRLVNTVKELTPYQAAIVGSAIYMGKLLPEAADFVKANQDALGRLPTAYFVVCMTMKDDTPQNRAKATAYLDPVRQEAHKVKPVAIGLFPGVVDFSKMSFMHKAMLKTMGSAEGDYRDFPAVKRWSSDANLKLLTVPGER